MNFRLYKVLSVARFVLRNGTNAFADGLYFCSVLKIHSQKTLGRNTLLKFFAAYDLLSDIAIYTTMGREKRLMVDAKAYMKHTRLFT